MEIYRTDNKSRITDKDGETSTRHVAQQRSHTSANAGQPTGFCEWTFPVIGSCVFTTRRERVCSGAKPISIKGSVKVPRCPTGHRSSQEV